MRAKTIDFQEPGKGNTYAKMRIGQHARGPLYPYWLAATESDTVKYVSDIEYDDFDIAYSFSIESKLRNDDETGYHYNEINKYTIRYEPDQDTVRGIYDNSGYDMLDLSLEDFKKWTQI